MSRPTSSLVRLRQLARLGRGAGVAADWPSPAAARSFACVAAHTPPAAQPQCADDGVCACLSPPASRVVCAPRCLSASISRHLSACRSLCRYASMPRPLSACLPVAAPVSPRLRARARPGCIAAIEGFYLRHKAVSAQQGTAGQAGGGGGGGGLQAREGAGTN